MGRVGCPLGLDALAQEILPTRGGSGACWADHDAVVAQYVRAHARRPAVAAMRRQILSGCIMRLRQPYDGPAMFVSTIVTVSSLVRTRTPSSELGRRGRRT